MHTSEQGQIAREGEKGGENHTPKKRKLGGGVATDGRKRRKVQTNTGLGGERYRSGRIARVGSWVCGEACVRLSILVPL